MAEGSLTSSPVAYTVEEVERYVEAVAAQRAELEVAIAGARARIALATPLEDRITVLEHRVAQLLAEREIAHRSASTPGVAPSPDGGDRVADHEASRP